VTDVGPSGSAQGSEPTDLGDVIDPKAIATLRSLGAPRRARVDPDTGRESQRRSAVMWNPVRDSEHLGPGLTWACRFQS